MRTVRFLLVVVVMATFLLTACGGSASTPEPAPVVEQPQEPAPTQAPSPTAAPVEPSPAQAQPTQPKYAPYCESAAATGCNAPTIEVLDNKYCIEKVPYVIMSAPAGTTYESLEPDMDCVDQLHSDGTVRITCHSITSKSLISYDMKVCNGACSTPVLQTGTGQCPEGYGYDPMNMCCAAPAPSGNDGCSTFTVDIGACADPQ